MIGLNAKKNRKQINEGALIMKTTNWYGAGRNTMARLILGMGLVCALALPVQAEWYFEVGPFYRGDMEISVRGGSRAADEGASAARSGTTGGLPSLGGSLSPDDGTAQILREFDDGYVGPSGWAWANTDGVTQFFAYDEPGQYDAAADTLTYQLSLGRESASQRRTQTRTTSESISWGKAGKQTDGASWPPLAMKCGMRSPGVWARRFGLVGWMGSRQTSGGIRVPATHRSQRIRNHRLA
jgi:hypothetical protein